MTARPVAIDQDYGGTNRARNLPDAMEPGDAVPLRQVLELAGSVFDHSQPTPSAEWVVNHNLGLRPSVTVLSPGGVEVEASVIHQSANQLRIYFAAPQSGSAHCV